ncbi:MAG: ribosomal-protein-alanine N-acetyltransferase [Syntrophus sp. PtaB.Bin001]|nr:MAG: ribosomal-protein-alanine N-acetyltransferase [Syntrophus sp. PtaB.Bin001]
MLSDNLDKTNLLILPLKKNYLEEIMAIEVSSFPDPWTSGMFIQELSISISRNITVWLASFDKLILAGYTIYWLVADEIQIQKIAVKPEFRRFGLATFIMNSIFHTFCSEGYKSATLEVRSTNKAAINLYEKLGFMINGVRPSYYSVKNEDALIMELDLTSVGIQTP